MHSDLTLVLVLIAVLGIAAQWLAWRLQWPAIVLLSLFGILVGPVAGWVVPSRDLGELVEPVIKLCVGVILFDGGLNLRWHELREAKGGVKRLVFSALPLSWGLGTLAAHYIGGLEWPVALVFGAIIVVTGPTVILPLLRQAGLRRRPASYLKWEGIVNDPIGALLAVLVFQFFVLSHQASGLELLLRLGLAAAAAFALGLGLAYLVAYAFNRGWVPEYLKPPVLLGAVFLVYSGANALHAEAGLLATTVMGVALANARLADIEELRRFKEYLAVLLVSTVFILITANIDPSILSHLNWRAAALLAAVLFLVRPLAIGLATLGSDMPWRERVLVGWIAPRGIVAAAVAGLFGPALVNAGYADAALLVPLVLSLVLVTVVAHGFSLPWLARKLGLAATDRNGVLIVGANPWSVELARTLKNLGVYVLVADTSWQRLRPARLSGLNYFYGEILSRSAEQRLELGEIGYLLAVTDNDAYNALVCSRFALILGRERVFQLPTFVDDDARQLHPTLRGRILFGKDARYDLLIERHYRDWRFQKTTITGDFTAQNYFDQLGEGAMPLLLLRPSGALSVRAGAGSLNPQPGDTVVGYVASQAPGSGS